MPPPHSQARRGTQSYNRTQPSTNPTQISSRLVHGRRPAFAFSGAGISHGPNHEGLSHKQIASPDCRLAAAVQLARLAEGPVPGHQMAGRSGDYVVRALAIALSPFRHSRAGCQGRSLPFSTTVGTAGETKPIPPQGHPYSVRTCRVSKVGAGGVRLPGSASALRALRRRLARRSRLRWATGPWPGQGFPTRVRCH